MYLWFILKNTSGKQKRGGDFAEPPKNLAIKKEEKKNADVILKFAFFIDEFMKMMKNS